MLGIFDSGSGGLSVLKEIMKVLPNADVIYFGDIKNAPYGSKSPEELKNLTRSAVERLLSEGATKIVLACNSVSATAINFEKLNLIEMVGPTVKSLAKEKKRILLAATPATINSKIYQNGFASKGVKIEVLAIPELAGAIEFGRPEPEIEKIIMKALSETDIDFEILILGCTHYPLVINQFKKILIRLGKKVSIYNPAVAVAAEVKRRMGETGKGTIRFLITKESKVFRDRVRKLNLTQSVSILRS